MASTPYDKQADYAYWKMAVSNHNYADLDPVIGMPFKLTRSHKIVTAGSCFAEHIGRYLKAAGANFLVTEPAHQFISQSAADETSYGRFSARYGNVYTGRQLLQLFDRAYGHFCPDEDIWQESSSVFIDPFRPNIQPGGFNSHREFEIDRRQHFAAVRAAFEMLDVFIFTLGLTECWRSRIDGAVFPLCPGVRGGQYSESIHEFVNFEIEDVVDDMQKFIQRLRSVNKNAKVILTVSPVPLAATAENRHVLVSTIYSKSVLRVACDKIVRSLRDVYYFPAYEIITGPRSNYFEEDGRSVTEAGIAHVMRVFFDHYLIERPILDKGVIVREVRRRLFGKSSTEITDLTSAFSAMCDEEALLLPPSGISDHTRNQHEAPEQTSAETPQAETGLTSTVQDSGPMSEG